ncbi:hypothetical protein [Microbacterium sp. UCD-TDU]|uniref:hypothetical protein n=1 Tax=Microbacterium sp. UCD-TDU TaxID=1247714 RepID=UPI000345083C|nr:hypothetical protein [Microbacterium sp. UCD-TDU]EYT61650.1 hypothetical protein D514_0102300 [Microbacterium sp. UCD-TDU]
MTERIDHAAEAMALFNSEFGTKPNYLPYETADAQHLLNILGAQVHATLALVEQQRIANLLTMAQFDHAIEDGVRLYTDLEWSAKLRQEAGERLGLS